jgi:hypothetical protein
MGDDHHRRRSIGSSLHILRYLNKYEFLMNPKKYNIMISEKIICFTDEDQINQFHSQ